MLNKMFVLLNESGVFEWTSVKSFNEQRFEYNFNGFVATGSFNVVEWSTISFYGVIFDGCVVRITLKLK